MAAGGAQDQSRDSYQGPAAQRICPFCRRLQHWQVKACIKSTRTDTGTATLPHEKYYNMDAYDRRMAALREGDLLPPDPNAYDFNADMNAVRSAHRKKPVHQEFTREQLEELRQVQKERDEVTFGMVLPKRATTTHLLHRLDAGSF